MPIRKDSRRHCTRIRIACRIRRVHASRDTCILRGHAPACASMTRNGTMEIVLTDDQAAIDRSVRRTCAGFGDNYWTDCKENRRFPEEHCQAMEKAGFLGITMPAELGSSGLGVTEAAIMMHAAKSSGGGYSAASATTEQKKRFLGPLIKGEQKACFGVTEPDAGLDTTSIKTFARRVDGGRPITGWKIRTSTAQQAPKILILARTAAKEDDRRLIDGLADFDRSKIEVRPIHKLGRKAVDSDAVFIDDLFVPDEDRIGDEGKGFYYVLDSLNPERDSSRHQGDRTRPQRRRPRGKICQGASRFRSAIGRTRRISIPSRSAGPFWGRPIGCAFGRPGSMTTQNSGGAEANAAKFLSGRAAFQGCRQRRSTPANIRSGASSGKRATAVDRWCKGARTRIGPQRSRGPLAPRINGMKGPSFSPSRRFRPTGEEGQGCREYSPSSSIGRARRS